MQLFESKSVEERVILVGIQDSREDEVKSLRELEELVDTAGAVTVGKVIQKRESIHPASYVGPGKLEELRTVVVPGLFDAETAVREASAVAAPWQDKHSMRYKIICYRPMGVRESEKQRLQQPTAEYLQQLADLARSQGIRDVVIT